MSSSSRKRATEVTMREFRAAPAKILRRAARTRAPLRVGDFLISVTESPSTGRATTLHGCMRETGRMTGSPAGLLSADDEWSLDG